MDKCRGFYIIVRVGKGEVIFFFRKLGKSFFFKVWKRFWNFIKILIGGVRGIFDRSNSLERWVCLRNKVIYIRVIFYCRREYKEKINFEICLFKRNKFDVCFIYLRVLDSRREELFLFLVLKWGGELIFVGRV